MKTKLSAAVDRFLRPVASEPVLFVLVMLLGSAAPLAMQAVSGPHLKYFTLFTLSVCSVEAYILAAAVSAIQRRALRTAAKAVIYSLYAFFALTETGCAVLFGKPLGVDMVSLALETNPSEAGGFFEAYFSLKLLVAWLAGALAVVMAAMAARLVCRIGRRHVALRAASAAVLLPLMLYGLYQIVFMGAGLAAPESARRGINHGGRTDLTLPMQLNLADPLFKTIDIYTEYRQIFNNIDHWTALQPEALKRPLEAAPNRDFNIVIVIGESFIRSHSSLYGYALPVNPLLGKELKAGRLTVFSDMATPANLTTEVMRNIMNLNDVASGEKWYESVYFPALVKKAGWNVYHYDNQTVGRTSDSGISRVFYSDFNMEYTLDGVSDSLFQFDGPYVRYVSDRLKERKPGKSMVIYHLLGQHFPAFARYEGEPVFSADDIEAPGLDRQQRQLVADYDNATLYNDRVVSEIIDRWRDTPTVLFYFSDHGEDLPDLGTVGGRVSANPSDRAWVERQYHIPFMVWMSDSFSDANAELAAAVREASTRPGMLDKLGYMVLGLAGVRSEYYRPERDMFSSQYSPEPRLTIGGFTCD